MNPQGIFITFEGMDGSGKTTQMRRLAGRLRGMGRTVLETAEPGGTPIGAKIRRILLDSANQELCPTAELLLYFASRAQNVDEWILPALERGEIVLADRFTDSSLVYQGYGRGLGAENVMALDRIACRGLKPHLTLLVDIDAETSLARARARNRARAALRNAHGRAIARIPPQGLRAYHELAAREPERVKLVDGRAAMDEIERRDLAPGERVCLRTSGATRTSPQALEQMMAQDRLAQTLLFAGPEGVGKATLARRLAARLLADAELDRAGRPQPAAQPRDRRRPRKMARRQAQRRSAALFHPSRFRHLRAGWPAAPDLHPADAPASRSARRSCRTRAAGASS